MSKTRPRSRRSKKKLWRKLTPLQKNEILVLREMGHTYKEICSATQHSYGTVQSTCLKAKNDPAEIQRVRGEAMLRAAQDTFGIAFKARDAIKPEDLVQERIPITDDDGNVTNILLRGPTPLQNATTYGILLDKAMKLEDRAGELTEGTGPRLDPSQIGALVAGLSGRLQNIQLNFGVDTSELQDRMEKIQADFTVLPGEDE